MNIFVLDSDAKKAARSLSDRHVVKMILESAQMMSAVAYRYGHEGLYKLTHKNHPCTLWAGNRYENWHWLYEHANEMDEEKKRRFGSSHKSIAVVNYHFSLGHGPEKDGKAIEPFAQAMPVQYRNDDAVIAYRDFYLNEKQFAKDLKRPKWTNTSPPEWWSFKE
jgi:hypothetical protein